MGLLIVGAAAVAFAAKTGFDFFQAMRKNEDEQTS